jgi:hypothetical protein
MTNEQGAYEDNPTLVTAMLNEDEALKLPYAVWFNQTSGRADSNKPLTDITGTQLLPNGTAFKPFVASH